MSNNKKSALRWSLLVGHLAIVSLLLACATLGLGPANVAQGVLQLDEGVIKVQNADGDWEPLAGESTFELVGTLENMQPWTVSGRTLQTNESTQIAEGLEVGNLVRVRGASLDDDTWLAYSIAPADEQTDQTITFIGRVTSVDPWVVNGITLNVTDDTVIDGEIEVGTLVKVEVLLLEDGTWEVISITPLGDVPSTNGCVTVIATVESVNGNEIKFLGWPTPVIVDLEDPSEDENSNDNDNDNENDENENDGEDVDLSALQPGQQVLAVVCVSENGQLVITQITVLDEDDASGGQEKVLVCHKPEKKGGHTISIAEPAVPAHLAHGDVLGPCP